MEKPVIALQIPTGIGANYGGYAGDFGYIARKFAKHFHCIVNPNAVNGGILSAINYDMSYVEGHLFDEFFKGNINITPLNPYETNKIGLIFDCEIPQNIINVHINTINALKMVQGIETIAIEYTTSPVGVEIVVENGISYGNLKNPETLVEASEKLIKKGANAIAVVCFFNEDAEDEDYSNASGIDPIGGVEAIISHLITKKFAIPSAHAPAFVDVDISEKIENPKVSSELISSTYLPCIMQGLSIAPKISKNGKTLTIFIGKRLDSQVKNDIESIFNTLNTKDTFSINGAFADYYKSSQIVLTSADQIVADELSFEKKVAIIEANSISSLNNSNVYKDISLPTSGLYNSKIEWTSSNTLIVSNSGKVTRPENGDVKVTLSYVITIDNQKTTSKNITVNVKQKGNTNYEYVYVEPNYSGTYYNQISDELRGKDLLLQLDNLLDSTSHPTINFTYKGLMSEVFPYTDGKDGKLYAFYRGTLASSGSMNREHVWPNSRGGNYVERDPHMVRPTLTSDNSGRGNAFYNESGNYDPGEFGAYQYRGICARIIFYCAVKAQENGLNLVDKNTDSTSNKSMGKLSTLLKWNLEYDIDATEIQRNDVLYTKFKHNRNPFIDDRNYACKIWGNTNAETRGVCSGNY